MQLLANYPKCPYIVEYKTHWIEYIDNNESIAQPIENQSSNDNESILSEKDLHSSDKVFIGDSDSTDFQEFGNIQKYLFIQQELCLITLSEAIKRIHSELIPGKGQPLPMIGQYVMSELMIELLHAVDYLHSYKIIHRDLKESNILLTNGYNNTFIKLCDFGLSTTHTLRNNDDYGAYQFTSNIYTNEAQEHTIGVGTDGYIAPEIRTGKIYDTKSDMFSLGVIMSHMFGVKPETIQE